MMKGGGGEPAWGCVLLWDEGREPEGGREYPSVPCCRVDVVAVVEQVADEEAKEHEHWVCAHDDVEEEEEPGVVAVGGEGGETGPVQVGGGRSYARGILKRPKQSAMALGVRRQKTQTQKNSSG